MKSNTFRIMYLVSVLLLCLLFMVSCEKKESDKNKVNMKDKIYNENADAKEDILNAIDSARQSGKNILLMFGGNWCVWCHRLHQLFSENEDINKILQESYILVMIDVGKRDKNLDLNEKYGNPYSLGFPVLVILDKEGNQIHTQETGSLEYAKEETAKKGHDPERVMNLLKTWAPNYSN